MRISETIFFKNGIVEVRSRPIWVAVIEWWFLQVHELTSHTLRLRLPYEDKHWGEPLEAAFHHFYYWSLGHGATIDQTAKYKNLKNVNKPLSE